MSNGTNTETKKGFFDRAAMRSRVRSANVKLPEAAIGYLVGPFCGLLANCLFGSFLVEYFRKVLFAGDTTGGVETFLTIFPILSAILIVAGNLVAGQIIERTRTRAGKARPWILISAITVAVASVLMFIPLPEGTSKVFKMVWLAIAYNLFYSVAFPLYNTANSAMVPVSTRNGKQRGLLASFVNMATLGGAGAGSIVMPVVLGLLAGVFPLDGSDSIPGAQGYLVLFIVIAVITFLGCLVQYYFTRERVTEETMAQEAIKQQDKAGEQKAAPALSMGKQAKALFSDKFFIVVIIFYFLYQMAGGIKNGSMQSFTLALGNSWGIEASWAMSILGIVGAVPMAVAILFVAPLCNKFGKQIVVLIGMALGAAGGVLAGIFYENFYVVAVGVAIKCLGSAPAGYMILAMIADVLDHGEAKNGFRCDGLAMSIYSSIMIASSPIATGIVSGLLGAFGDVDGSTVSSIWIETVAYGHDLLRRRKISDQRQADHPRSPEGGSGSCGRRVDPARRAPAPRRGRVRPHGGRSAQRRAARPVRKEGPQLRRRRGKIPGQAGSQAAEGGSQKEEITGSSPKKRPGASPGLLPPRGGEGAFLPRNIFRRA